MAFGGSTGDIVKCVELCIDIYRFWQNAEQDVQGVLARFRYTKDQLTSLEDLLHETGWTRYPFATELKKDLEEHYEFFKALPSLSGQEPHGRPLVLSKSIDKAKLAWKTDDLSRIKTNIDDHCRRLNDFKQDVVL